MRLDMEGKAVSRNLRTILQSDRPETEKLALAFASVTGEAIQAAERKIELALALEDQGGKIRHQVIRETMRSSRRIFRWCHLLVTGKEAWDEPERG